MRRLSLALVFALIAPLAFSQTTRVYTYDALGRLVKVTPGTGTPVCYTHDAADNRTLVSASAGCTAGGGGPNSPPDAQDDSLFFMSTGPTWNGNLGVLLNDTDPNLPNDVLTVVSVTGSPYASVQGGGSDVHFSGPVGSYTLTYTIKDQSNATDSATIDLVLVYCGLVEC